MKFMRGGRGPNLLISSLFTEIRNTKRVPTESKWRKNFRWNSFCCTGVKSTTSRVVVTASTRTWSQAFRTSRLKLTGKPTSSLMLLRELTFSLLTKRKSILTLNRSLKSGISNKLRPLRPEGRDLSLTRMSKCHEKQALHLWRRKK